MAASGRAAGQSRRPTQGVQGFQGVVPRDRGQGRSRRFGERSRRNVRVHSATFSIMARLPDYSEGFFGSGSSPAARSRSTICRLCSECGNPYPPVPRQAERPRCCSTVTQCLAEVRLNGRRSGQSVLPDYSPLGFCSCCSGNSPLARRAAIACLPPRIRQSRA
jgi:hypothetical protein